MNRIIFDNGYKILGQVNYIIEYLKENIENAYEKDTEEYEEALKDLEELKNNYDKTDIIVYNYDCQMSRYYVEDIFKQEDKLEYYKDLEGEDNE